jgi:hypothetical protein
MKPSHHIYLLFSALISTAGCKEAPASTGPESADDTVSEAAGSLGASGFWPDGLKADVEIFLEGAASGGPKGTSDKWAVQTKLTWVGTMSDKGYAVAQSGFSGWTGQLPKSPAPSATFVLPHYAGWKFDADGTVVALVDHPGSATSWDRWLSSHWELGASKALFENMSQKASMLAIADDQWNGFFQNWWVRKLAPGESFEATTRTQVPQLGGGELNLDMKIENLGEEACGPDQDRRCFRMSFTSTPRQADIEAALKRILAKANKGDAHLSRFNQLVRLEILLDIKNRLPFEQHFDRSSTFTVSQSKSEQKMNVESSESRKIVWTYHAGLL